MHIISIIYSLVSLTKFTRRALSNYTDVQKGRLSVPGLSSLIDKALSSALRDYPVSTQSEVHAC